MNASIPYIFMTKEVVPKNIYICNICLRIGVSLWGMAKGRPFVDAVQEDYTLSIGGAR